MQQTKLPQLGYYMCFSAELPDYGQTVAEIVLDAIEALHLTGNVKAYAGNHPISGEYGFAIAFDRQNGAKGQPKEWWMPLSESVSQLCQTNGQIQFLTDMSELAEIDNIRDVAEGQGTIAVSMGRPAAIRDDIESWFINEAKSRIATTQPDGCSSMKEPSYKQNTDPSLLFAEKLIRTMPPAIYQIIVKAGNVGLAYENQSWINSRFVTVVRNDTQVLYVAKLGNKIMKEGSFESRDSYQIITAILQCDVETMLLKQHEMTTDAWDKLQEIGSTEYCNGAYKCMLEALTSFNKSATHQEANHSESPDQKRSRHLKFIDDQYAALAAFAWKSFRENGRGTLVSTRQDGEPDCSIGYVPLNDDNNLPDSLLQQVKTYNPEKQFVIVIGEGDWGTSYVSEKKDLPPP